MPHFLLVLLAAALVGCGFQPDPYACANDDGIFPGERLSDWKGYADHVALVSVEGNRKERVETIVEVEVLDTYFRGRGAPDLPRTLDVHTRAYMLEGERYVTPLVFLDPDEVWITQSCSAPVLVDDGEVAAPEKPSDGYKPLQEALAGTPVAEFARLMREARVKPEVRPYLDRRTEQRSRCVYGPRGRCRS